MSNTSRNSNTRAGGRGTGANLKTADRESVSALESHLGYWLRVVSNHVSESFRTKVEQHGVTVAEWVVLRALFDEDGIKPSDLATTLGLSRGAVSKLIDRLVAKDFVSVRSDTHDGRAQVITVRASGRRLVPTLAALADRNDAETFGHLSRHDRSVLLATLKGIAERRDVRGAALD
jgi:DNA-binding MarR family transcriptional regulator